MPREKDPFRDHVEFLQNNKWKCNFCNKEYGGGATRIKAHLAGAGGYGINDCKDVDGQVRLDALKTLKGKRVVESSNGSEGNAQGSSYPLLISSCHTQGPHLLVNVSNEDARRDTSFAAMPNLSFDAISTIVASSSALLPLHETNVPSQYLPAQNMIPQWDFSFWTQPPQSHAGDSNIQPRNLSYPSSSGDVAPEGARTRVAQAESELDTCEFASENITSLKRKLEELIRSGKANMNELNSKWKRIKEECWSVVQAIKEGRSIPLEKVTEVEELSKEAEEIFLVPGRFQQGLTELDKGCSRRSPLVTTELVGEQAYQEVDEIYSFLMQDKIFVIGVCGMSGVGKTAILMHVHNRLLEDPAFDNVFWVTVPQDFSVYALQEEIANAVGLEYLSKEKNVKRRAGILYGHLKKNKRSVVILDGLWMHLEVKEVGIPVETGSLKLVLTTQSLHVCRMMLCQKQIKIKLLDRKQSWRLFSKTLCFAEELPSEVKQIAKSILHRCDGLPHGIIEIATRMRSVEKVLEWKSMLRKLEDSRIELDVVKRLKLTYRNLGDHQVQRCFLHLIVCFGQDLSKTNRVDVIESFIDEGLLNGAASRQELHDQGNDILDTIRMACMWGDPEEESLYLHPLMRDMALQIMTSTTHMVKACMGLQELPEEEFWTGHLEKVFLQGNGMKDIPYGISPNCPKLTRLSLNNNDMLRVIHESFLRHLKGLKVLDLSYTKIMELPYPISDLESLEALLLRGCHALRRIPSIGKLGSLRKLDLNGCANLEEVPEGMEMLVKLRYLDLLGTKIETLPEGVLGKLVNLQYLAIKKVRAGEEAKLKKVEALHCCVPNVETFNACVMLLERNSSRRYRLVIDALEYYDFRRIEETDRHIFIDSCDHISASVDGTSGDGCALLPKSVQSLRVRRCSGMTNLRDIGPLEKLEELMTEEWENLREINIAAPSLRRMEVSECHKMKRVVEWEWLTTCLPNLKEIVIKNCEKLEEIIVGPLRNGAVCLLTVLGIKGCNNMKRVLLTQGMLLDLPFLHSIRVEDCKGIEVVIGNVAHLRHSLPNLRHLTLWNLPELRSLCDGTMSCDSIEWLDVKGCPNLKRIPLQLPLLDNGLPSLPPFLREIKIDNRQTWESLEWDHPLVPCLLERFLRLDPVKLMEEWLLACEGLLD